MNRRLSQVIRVAYSSAVANRRGAGSTLLAALALAGLAACRDGATEAKRPVDPTAVVRVEIVAQADTIALGDSVVVSARALNSAGVEVAGSVPVWTSPDSTVLSVSGAGVLRGRNVGAVRLEVMVNGVVGTRTLRVASRAIRVRMVAPDTAQVVTQHDVSVDVETAAGLALPGVAPRLVVVDTSIATLTTVAAGRGRLSTLRPGRTEWLAIIGRDTTRRPLVVSMLPLRSLRLRVGPRTLALGDSVPLEITVVDTSGRTVPPFGTFLTVESPGAILIRNNHAIAVGAGRAILQLTNGMLMSLDTIVAQGPSEFPLEIVDGNGQDPLPFRVRLSMERVEKKWKSIIRGGPPGERVTLEAGECRNAERVSQFVAGIRVLITLDTLPARIAGQGGPCVVRQSGQPLLGTISLNLFTWAGLSDRKLDDLIQHEVGHVLGIGTMWNRGPFRTMFEGTFQSPDPIFFGPNALLAFERLSRAHRFSGRRIPVEEGALGHWRLNAFSSEVMAPALTTAPQGTSAITVGVLADLGWTVEPEAYDDYVLPDAVLTPDVTARVLSTAMASHSLEHDALPPLLMQLAGGGKVRLDPLGRPIYR